MVLYFGVLFTFLTIIFISVFFADFLCNPFSVYRSFLTRSTADHHSFSAGLQTSLKNFSTSRLNALKVFASKAISKRTAL